MEKKKRIPGWVLGCGAGCAAVVVLAVVIVGSGFLYFKGVLSDFVEADRGMEEIEDRLGSPADYHPAPDGAIRAERIEAFLTVRGNLAHMTARVTESLDLLARDESEVGVPSKIWTGIGLLGDLAGYVKRRNETLLEAGMGLGEYYHIYTLAYYSWLGKSPADGPPFKLVGPDGYILDEITIDLDESEAREYRLREGRRIMNRLMLEVLRNQLSDLQGEAINAQREWLDALTTEITALEGDDQRLPWEGDLPEVLESSLRTYREHLEESYSAQCNAIEVGLARRQG